MDTKICAACGAAFERPFALHPADWERRQFCSRRCAATVPRKNRYVTEPVKSCIVCAKDYGPSPGQRGIAWERRKYCSLTCAARARSEAAWGRREKVTCAVCRTTVAVQFPDQATCLSRDCKAEYRRTIMAEKIREKIKAGYARGDRPPGRGVSPRETDIWPAMADFGFVWRMRWTEPDGLTIECDFADWDRRLNIEIDGPEHKWEPRKSRDARRDALLGERGWRILRIQNADVDSDPAAVVARVEEFIALK